MKANGSFEKKLPDRFDKVAKIEGKKQQTIYALTDSFEQCVRAKHKSESSLEAVIQKLSIKEINDIFFDDEVPNVPRSNYCEIIDEFLNNSYFYQSHFESIIEGYLQIVVDLREHIQHLLINGHTDETNENYRTSTANYLDARLTSISERTKLVISIHKEIEELQKDISNRTSDIGSLNSTIAVLSKKVNETKITSDQIMPNIISLMGVFSSVIVVILSLITTSSTWLSNANETNVLIAFVVPAGIITLAVCALTALVRSSIDTRNEPMKPDKTKHWLSRLFLAIGQFFQKWGLWLCIATVTVLIICSTTNYCQKTSDDQTHYIVKCLPASDFGDDSSTDGETQTTSGTLAQELFVVQEIVLPTGEVYPDKISCAEKDIHSDGFVYYCLLHQRFE